MFFGQLTAAGDQGALRRLPGSLRALAGDRRGAAAVEFAIVGPALAMMMIAGVQLGLAFYNQNALNQIATQAARLFAEERGVSTTPYTDTTSAITTAQGGYSTLSGTITTTMYVNGTACASDSACNTALSTAAGQAAKVQLSYPCPTTNFVPIATCPIVVSATYRVE